MPAFPGERAAKRAALLDAVDRVRDVVAAQADEGERIATLPAPTVAALEHAGLLTLKLPAALGGAEADPVTPSTSGERFGVRSAGPVRARPSRCCADDVSG